MKFEELKAVKPNEKKIISQMQSLTEELKNAKSAQEAIKVVQKSFKLSDSVESNFTIISIRHSIDMNDKKISKLSDICDEVGPKLSEYSVAFDRAIMESPFKEDLVKKFGETFFKRIENEFKVFDPKIIPDKIKENQLVNEYQKIIAGAQIQFRGETYNLSSIGKFMSDVDRDTRIEAAKAYYGYLEQNDAELGRIYDELVKVRDKIAKTLGFKNAIEYEYLALGRLDYDEKMVKEYRDQIYEEVVPIAVKLRKRQAKRIGVKKPLFVDYNLEFLSGNAKPCGDSKYLCECASKMYHEMSPLTGDFFDKMVNDHLLDLDAKPGKAACGYCTFIPNYQSPFIFANFNQTSGDAEVLTHEAGHAFQCYSSQNIFPIDCILPTSESCEIHSMSMEFFTYPWMKSFFEEDTEKYYFKHLSGTAKFLPYGVCVDHFQHEVYANPDMSPEERMATWRKLEKQYLPYKNYDEIDILEKGGWWMRQLHIFMYPFYYIDYTLAQVCALQFWARIQKQDPKAFEDYKHICQIGGTLPFRKIVKEAGLNVPFDSGCLKDTMKEVRAWFDKADDSKF